MSLGLEHSEGPPPTPGTPEQSREEMPEAVKQKLYTASWALKGKRGEAELMFEAERLVQSGILYKYESDEGPDRRVIYEVYNPNSRSTHSSTLRVLVLIYAPDFHRGRGEKFVTSELTLYSEQGLTIEALTITADGAVLKSDAYKYHPNGTVKGLHRIDNLYGKRVEEVYEFDEAGKLVNSQMKK